MRLESTQTIAHVHGLTKNLRFQTVCVEKKSIFAHFYVRESASNVLLHTVTIIMFTNVCTLYISSMYLYSTCGCYVITM